VEVTKQMKPTVGRYQTEIRFRVKVLSLENTNIERVDSVHLLEDRISYSVRVRDNLSLRGLSHWYGIARKPQELGRACISSHRGIVANNPKRRGRSEDMQAVGLTHSRGVIGVMPDESFIRHSKGLAILCKGEGKHYQASQRRCN
jgi:hypothetical protein